MATVTVSASRYTSPICACRTFMKLNLLIGCWSTCNRCWGLPVWIQFPGEFMSWLLGQKLHCSYNLRLSCWISKSTLRQAMQCFLTTSVNIVNIMSCSISPTTWILTLTTGISPSLCFLSAVVLPCLLPPILLMTCAKVAGMRNTKACNLFKHLPWTVCIVRESQHFSIGRALSVATAITRFPVQMLRLRGGLRKMSESGCDMDSWASSILKLQTSLKNIILGCSGELFAYAHNNSQHTMQVANDTRDLGDWLRTLSFHLEHFGALQLQNPKPDQLLLSIKQVFLNPLVGKNAKCEPRNHRGRGDRSIWKEKLLLPWPCLGVSHMTLARTPSISATAPCQWWKWRMNIGSQGMILSTSNTSRW